MAISTAVKARNATHAKGETTMSLPGGAASDAATSVEMGTADESRAMAMPFGALP